MDFNPDDTGYRRLLALSIRDYLNNPANTKSGRKDSARKTLESLSEDMKAAGHGISRPTLSRLQFPRPREERGSSYPTQAEAVAQYLHGLGFYPPGRDVPNSLKILPIFFGGFIPSATKMLSELHGEFVSYQFSNRRPDHVIAGTMKIGAPNEWRFSDVEEDIVYSLLGKNHLHYRGAVFSDEERNIYVLMREETHRYPRFYLFEDCNRRADGQIETAYGLVLSGARQRKRHFSPVVLYRGDAPRPEGLVPRDRLRDELPAVVAEYLSLELRPGPGQY